MKKIHCRILLATTALSIAGFGCVNENREPHDPIVKLAFEPVMHVQVRSTANSETPDAAQETNTFGVSAWYLDEGTSWSNGADQAQTLLTSSRLVQNGNFWYPESGIDWPSKRYSVSCIGFSPFEAIDACTPTEGVVFREVDTSTDPGDLRYTEPQTNLSKSQNGGIITLPMIPALCEVDFRVRSATGYEQTKVYVRSIALDGLSLKGDFHSLPEPAWTTTGITESLNFFEGDLQVSYEPQRIGQTRRLIPQKLKGMILVEYEYEAPSEERLHQAETELVIERNLEAGRQYTITLAVSPSGVEIITETPSQNE